jgi:hypothetical protein
MKTEEQAAQAIVSDSWLAASVRPANGEKASRWSFGAGQSTFEADVALRVIASKAWLFVEPDDAARAPQNITKYWMWMVEKGITDPVFVVHPIGPSNDSAWHLACFLGARIAALHPNFTHCPFRVLDWHDGHWLSDLLVTIRQIVEREVAKTQQ